MYSEGEGRKQMLSPLHQYYRVLDGANLCIPSETALLLIEHNHIAEINYRFTL